MSDNANYGQGGGTGYKRDSSFTCNSLRLPENPNLNWPLPNLGTDSHLFNSTYEAPSFTQVFVLPCNQAQPPSDTQPSPAPAPAPPAEQKHNALLDGALTMGGSALTGGGLLAGGHHAWNKWWSPQARDSKAASTNPGAILSTQGDLNNPETIGIQRFSGTDGTFERTTSITGNKTLAFTPAGGEPPSYNLSINPKRTEFDVWRFDQPGSVSSPVERAVVSMQGKVVTGDPGLVSASYRQIADGLKGCGAIELDAKVLQALKVMKSVAEIL